MRFEQVPFGADRLAANPEPRCPCLLVLDNSGSMAGQPIDELNAGLVQFKDELVADSLAAKRVEIGIVSFGPVSTVTDFVTDFVTADELYPPELQKAGDTPMGAAIECAVEMIRQRKEVCTTGRLARGCLRDLGRQPWLQRGDRSFGDDLVSLGLAHPWSGYKQSWCG